MNMKLLLAVLAAAALAGAPAVTAADDALRDNRQQRLEANRNAAEALRQRGRDQAGEHRSMMRDRMERLDQDARQRNDRVRERSQQPFNGIDRGPAR